MWIPEIKAKTEEAPINLAIIFGASPGAVFPFKTESGAVDVQITRGNIAAQWLNSPGPGTAIYLVITLGRLAHKKAPVKIQATQSGGRGATWEVAFQSNWRGVLFSRVQFKVGIRKDVRQKSAFGLEYVAAAISEFISLC